MAATAWLYLVVPKGFLPDQDTGLLIGTTDAPQDISFRAMSDRQLAVAEIIRKDPEVVSVDDRNEHCALLGRGEQVIEYEIGGAAIFSESCDEQMINFVEDEWRDDGD